MSSWRIR